MRLPPEFGAEMAGEPNTLLESPGLMTEYDQRCNGAEAGPKKGLCPECAGSWPYMGQSGLCAAANVQVTTVDTNSFILLGKRCAKAMAKIEKDKKERNFALSEKK